MQLGLFKDEVKIVPYEEGWKSEFIKVKNDLMEHGNLKDKQIEHIGSTSIKGMVAKPVIDIMVGVNRLNTLDKKFFKNLQRIGFYRLQIERPHEIVCAKFTDQSFEMKTHFIHIVEYGNEKWQQMLFFRDYLNAHEDAKQQYQALKSNFFSTDLAGINAYTKYKEQFIQSIFDKMEGY